MDKKAVTTNEPISRMGYIVAIIIFIAMVADGMDAQFLAMSLPVLMKDFQLNNVMAGLLTTWTLLGMLIGGTLSGWLSDRFGRVKVTAYGIIFFSVCTSALALTNTFWQFAVIRFISGFGLAAVFSVGTVMAAEYIPTSRRTTVLGIIQAGLSVGYVMAAVLSAYFLPNFGWRPMFAIAILPAFLSIVLLRTLKESPSWIAAREQRKLDKKPTNEWVNIFSDKTSRKYFLLWIITSFFLQAGFYGANSWLPTYLAKDLGVNLKTVGWFVAGNYTMMIFGKILAGYLADRFGRKIVWVLFCLATAVTLPLVMTYAQPANVGYFLLIFGFLYGAPFAIIATYMNESFPTKVRGTAVAAAYNGGRVGSLIAPVAIGYLATQYSVGYGIAILGVAYAIGALNTGLFIREKLYDPQSLDTATMSTACIEKETEGSSIMR